MLSTSPIEWSTRYIARYTRFLNFLLIVVSLSILSLVIVAIVVAFCHKLLIVVLSRNRSGSSVGSVVEFWLTNVIVCAVAVSQRQLAVSQGV